jgi:hypothetical protein
MDPASESLAGFAFSGWRSIAHSPEKQTWK